MEKKKSGMKYHQDLHHQYVKERSSASEWIPSKAAPQHTRILRISSVTTEVQGGEIKLKAGTLLLFWCKSLTLN